MDGERDCNVLHWMVHPYYNDHTAVYMCTFDKISLAISSSMSSVFLPLPPPLLWDCVNSTESNSYIHTYSV